jgi:uncharacterized protein (TIGR03435 family)
VTYLAFRHAFSCAIAAHVSQGALVNHLWQSTGVFIAAWLLALGLRRNAARTRYWMWMTASVKFLVPFSLFIWVGEAMRPVVSTPAASPRLAVVMQQITQPFAQSAAPSDLTEFGSVTPSVAAPHGNHWLLIALVALWLCGLFAVTASWIAGWLKMRRVARSAAAVSAVHAPWLRARPDGVTIRVTDDLVEPGVFGILRPVLLLPGTIAEKLSEEQLAAILAHEMAHVRRRDNLTAALHMVVCALFWFHPAVWWIKSRLLEERERACDEAVLQSGNRAQLYAESILNVCRLYVESPVGCVTGVTGSDLKQRIVRILSGQATLRLGLGRKLLLGAVGVAAVALPVAVGLVHMTAVHAQDATPAKQDGLAGTWQGTLHPGHDLRIVLKITKAADGSYKSNFYSIDQGGAMISVDTTTLQGSAVKLSAGSIGGKYEGTLSQDGNTITGTWSQGPSPLPLVLTRATPETAWTIPPPPPVIPPMDENASPTFEVATIKPTKPDERRKAFVVNGRRLHVINMDLTELMTISYNVQAKQILGLPKWAETDKYDIDAEPDGQGEPNLKQWKGMVQKLLADRFGLKLHEEKRVLPVYVLTVAKSGSKLTKAQAGPNSLPGFGFGGLGNLRVMNATMVDFSQFLQSAVMDRPVVDQTGLSGRWNFSLDWTPDDSQFGGAAASLPPPAKGTTPPPDIYTAIQEQDGLKLDAAKAPAEVLVIDHVDHPSPN